MKRAQKWGRVAGFGIGPMGRWGWLLGALLTTLWASQVPGSVPSDPEPSGPTWIVVLDTSHSMSATDMTPHRLSRAKEQLDRAAQEGAFPQAALVTVTHQAETRCAVTQDMGAFRTILRGIDLEFETRWGTGLSMGVHRALRLAKDSEPAAILLVSDGENHDDSTAMQAALQAAKQQRVPIYTACVGTETGAQLFREEAGRRVPIRFQQQPVVSRGNPRVMRRWAEATGGAAVPWDQMAEEVALHGIESEGEQSLASGGHAASLPLSLSFLILWTGLLMRGRR